MSKSNSFWDHPIATIEKAIGLRKQIEALQASLAGILGGAKQHVSAHLSAPVGAQRVDGRKGKRSPAARAKMAAAQKARWAKKRGASVETAPAAAAEKAPKKKRTMSPEARAKIAAAQRARWAKQKK